MPVCRLEVTHVVATTGAPWHYVVHLSGAGMEAQPADIREGQHDDAVASEGGAVRPGVPNHVSSGEPVELLHDLA